MIMPFVRLVSIYVVVILVVVAIFKRDEIAELTGITYPWAQSEQETQGEDTAPAPAAAPAAQEQETVQEAPASAATAAAEAPEQPAPQQPAQVQQPVQQPAAEQTAARPPIQMPVADPEPAQAPQQQTAPAPAPQAAQAATPGGDDTQARLNEARKTYWNGDIAAAEALYAALARDKPDNVDVQGEYGNILYAQRRYGEAAQAYFAAGRLLVESGRTAQAMPLVNVLQAIAPQQAASLFALMAE